MKSPLSLAVLIAISATFSTGALAADLIGHTNQGNSSETTAPYSSAYGYNSKAEGQFATSNGSETHAEGNRSNVAFGSGTLNIAHQGTNEYVITLDAKTLREETFKFTYTGAITIGGTSTAAVTPTVTKIPSSVIPMMYEAMKRDAVVVRDLSASKAETILALPDQAPAQRLHKELASKR